MKASLPTETEAWEAMKKALSYSKLLLQLGRKFSRKTL
jgi:hypothetical protein